jgi:periplasmic divalent cation tolerance protein
VLAVYVTVGTLDEARSLAERAVQARLAACANLFPGITSIYEWQGQLCRSEEFVLWLKTTEAQVTPLMQMLEQHHSYQCPCIVSLPIEGGHEPYLQWVRAQTS